jgi:hypothetical protein
MHRLDPRYLDGGGNCRGRPIARCVHGDQVRTDRGARQGDLEGAVRRGRRRLCADRHVVGSGCLAAQHDRLPIGRYGRRSAQLHRRRLGVHGECPRSPRPGLQKAEQSTGSDLGGEPVGSVRQVSRTVDHRVVRDLAGDCLAVELEVYVIGVVAFCVHPQLQRVQGCRSDNAFRESGQRRTLGFGPKRTDGHRSDEN